MAPDAPRGAGALSGRPGSPRARAVLDRLRARPALAAAVVYGLLSVALYAPALVPGHTLSASDYLWTAAPWSSSRPPDVRAFGSNFELVDSVLQFQPWLQYSRARLPDAPLWNPHLGGGRPFVGNGQSALLSPFSLPSYVLPFWWSLGVVAVLKVFVAAFGTFLLARALGQRFAGALLAGVVFAFSLFFVVWVSWPQTGVWALLPWLLLATERLLRRPGPLPAAALAAVVALQFLAGHPESNFHLLLVTVAFFAFRLVTLRRAEGGGPAAGPATVGFAGALAGGAALAAITLLPFLELLRQSNDVATRQTYWKLTLSREYLLGFALPDYWGRGTQTEVGAFAQGRAVYVGALPLLLAGVAVVRRPSALRVGAAVLGALMLAVVVGVAPLPQLISHVPLIRTGNHLRLVIVLVLCLALLAGWGLDDVVAGRVRRRGLVLAAGAALLLAPVVVLAGRGDLRASVLGDALRVAWGFADAPANGFDPRTAQVLHLSALLVWLPLMAAGLALVAARLWGRIGATPFAALALALVVVDLFHAGMGQTPAIPVDHATQPSTTPALRYLRAQRPNRFVGLARPLGPSPITPDVAMRLGLYDARSYDVPVERRYDRLWRRAVQDGGPTEFPTNTAVLTARSLPALRLLSVTDVVQDPAERPLRTLPLAYRGPDARIYRLPGALPRAGVVDAQRVVSAGDAELDAVLAPGFDGRRTLVTSKALPGLRPAPGPGPAGVARIVRYAPERVVVEAAARRASALVLTDVQYPGWTARLDGREVDLHRVDWVLRGVALPPGRHTVELRYEPASWRAGWVVSLLALLGLGATVVLGRRAARPRRSPRAPAG